FDTPLAESAIVSLGLGLTLENYRPVVEIQFFGFLFEAMDGIAGQIARHRIRSGASKKTPIVVRAPFGGGVNTPELHADSLEGLMAQTPGLKVVIPSNPIDAKGLLISAIRSEDPVIFLEHMKLYRSFREDVQEEEYEVENYNTNVKCDGEDVTLMAYGDMVQEAIKAAYQLAEEDIQADVIDLRTVSTVDYASLVKPVKKTNRAVVIQ